jgi:capsular polysaccharide biosynthesis protein
MSHLVHLCIVTMIFVSFLAISPSYTDGRTMKIMLLVNQPWVSDARSLNYDDILI